MKASGLFLSVMLFCVGCAAPRDRLGGPPLADGENFDRAGIEVIKGGFPPGRQPDGNTVVLASADAWVKPVSPAQENPEMNARYACGRLRSYVANGLRKGAVREDCAAWLR